MPRASPLEILVSPKFIGIALRMKAARIRSWLKQGSAHTNRLGYFRKVGYLANLSKIEVF